MMRMFFGEKTSPKPNIDWNALSVHIERLQSALDDTYNLVQPENRIKHIEAERAELFKLLRLAPTVSRGLTPEATQQHISKLLVSLGPPGQSTKSTSQSTQRQLTNVQQLSKDAAEKIKELRSFQEQKKKETLQYVKLEQKLSGKTAKARSPSSSKPGASLPEETTTSNIEQLLEIAISTDSIKQVFQHFDDILSFTILSRPLEESAVVDDSDTAIQAARQQASALNQALTVFQQVIIGIIDHPENTTPAETFQKLFIQIQTLNQKHPDAICRSIASAVLEKAQKKYNTLEHQLSEQHIIEGLVWEGHQAMEAKRQQRNKIPWIMEQFQSYVKGTPSPPENALSGNATAQNRRLYEVLMPIVRAIRAFKQMISRITPRLARVNQQTTSRTGTSTQTQSAIEVAPSATQTQSPTIETNLTSTSPDNRAAIAQHLLEAEKHNQQPIDQNNVFFSAVNQSIDDRMAFVASICKGLPSDSRAYDILIPLALAKLKANPTIDQQEQSPEANLVATFTEYIQYTIKYGSKHPNLIPVFERYLDTTLSTKPDAAQRIARSLGLPSSQQYTQQNLKTFYQKAIAKQIVQNLAQTPSLTAVTCKQSVAEAFPALADDSEIMDNIRRTLIKATHHCLTESPTEGIPVVQDKFVSTDQSTAQLLSISQLCTEIISTYLPDTQTTENITERMKPYQDMLNTIKAVEELNNIGAEQLLADALMTRLETDRTSMEDGISMSKITLAQPFRFPSATISAYEQTNEEGAQQSEGNDEKARQDALALMSLLATMQNQPPQESPAPEEKTTTATYTIDTISTYLSACIDSSLNKPLTDDLRSSLTQYATSIEAVQPLGSSENSSTVPSVWNRARQSLTRQSLTRQSLTRQSLSGITQPLLRTPMNNRLPSAKLPTSSTKSPPTSTKSPPSSTGEQSPTSPTKSPPISSTRGPAPASSTRGPASASSTRQQSPTSSTR